MGLGYLDEFAPSLLAKRGKRTEQRPKREFIILKKKRRKFSEIPSILEIYGIVRAISHLWAL